MSHPQNLKLLYHSPTFIKSHAWVNSSNSSCVCVCVYRTSRDWGRRAGRAETHSAEQSFGQDVFRQAAICPSGLSHVLLVEKFSYLHQFCTICVFYFFPIIFDQISRVLQLRSDGRLEQTVCMALENQPLTQHLHITYRRTSSPLKSQ